MRDETYKKLGFYISIVIFALIISASVTGFLLVSTSPRDIGAFGVTIWFIALFILFTTITLLIRYNFSRRRYPETQERLTLFKKSLRGSLIFALFVTIGLAMQSLRMLNLGDVLLFVMTIAIIELYFRTKKS